MLGSLLARLWMEFSTSGSADSPMSSDLVSSLELLRSPQAPGRLGSKPSPLELAVKGADCPGAEESQADSNQCRAVLEQHHEGGRVLALAKRLNMTLLAMQVRDGCANS